MPNHDDWAAEVEHAHTLLASEGEDSFRIEMERLGFTADEIDRFVTLEKATAASTDPTWPDKCRRAL